MAASDNSAMSRLGNFLRANPTVPLAVLLAALVILLEIMRPGIVNDRWIGNTVKFAVPLAMLAPFGTSPGLAPCDPRGHVHGRMTHPDRKDRRPTSSTA